MARCRALLHCRSSRLHTVLPQLSLRASLHVAEHLARLVASASWGLGYRDGGEKT